MPSLLSSQDLARCDASDYRFSVTIMLKVMWPLILICFTITFCPLTQSLIPAIVNAISDNFYKIVSEALLVAQQLVQVSVFTIDDAAGFLVKGNVLYVFESLWELSSRSKTIFN